MKFKLLPGAGNHTEKDENGEIITYHAKDGNVIESDVDLAKVFVGKFERIEVGASDVSVKASGDLGKDVTERFENAKEEGFLVFLKGKSYSVADADDPQVALNEEPLKKADVEPFVAKRIDE